MADTQPSQADGFWSLFQATDHVRIDGLRLVQVHALLRSFSVFGLEPWFAWYEGAPDWAPLADLVDVVNEAGKTYGLPPIPPAATPIAAATSSALAASPASAASTVAEPQFPPNPETDPRIELETETVARPTQKPSEQPAETQPDLLLDPVMDPDTQPAIVVRPVEIKTLRKNSMVRPSNDKKSAPVQKTEPAKTKKPAKTENTPVEKSITKSKSGSTQTQTGTQTKSKSVTITRSLARDGRMIPRFNIAMNAVVDYKGKLVQSETVDISLGGMKIKDPLPFPTEAIVIVTLNYQNTELVMRCRVVDSASGGNKHRLLIETCHRMDLLRNWIVGQKPA